MAQAGAGDHDAPVAVVDQGVHDVGLHVGIVVDDGDLFLEAGVDS